MGKNHKKYTYYSFFIVFVFVLLIFVIADFVITVLKPNFWGKLCIFTSASLFIGIVISAGLSVISPAISEAILTFRKMLRIENLSNPLLLRLSSEAPGTYHHSLNVSALAQKAAKSIKADSLLVRTAAYYHDIGKLENPHTFVENQSGKEIPTDEDKETIRISAEKIISHVIDGVKIANENHLPEDVIKLITEHHGTTKALYFYNVAKEIGLKIKKTDFQYKGPVPSSKESAILMLADCVEATARATSDLDIKKIKTIINNTINDRLGDGQLDKSGLSETELTKIKISLTETLRTIYHQRIDYKNENKNLQSS